MATKASDPGSGIGVNRKARPSALMKNWPDAFSSRLRE
jgi:hypothetical protein